MRFRATEIPGVFVVMPEQVNDDRGFFARLYCPEEFAAAGLEFKPLQVSISRNVQRLTLRGLHYQDPPFAEAKLVHVTHGSSYDVIVDLRRDSGTFGRWVAFDLNATSVQGIFVPEGCAHGFLTLESDTDVLYHISPMHVPGRAKGYRWNDPVLNIRWPAEPKFVSASDLTWPDFPIKG